LRASTPSHKYIHTTISRISERRKILDGLETDIEDVDVLELAVLEGHKQLLEDLLEVHLATS